MTAFQNLLASVLENVPPQNGHSWDENAQSICDWIHAADALPIIPELNARLVEYRKAHPATTQGYQSRPRWDESKRSLWFGKVLVKKFTKPAPNQIRVLAAFQEEAWVERILDPLTPGRRADVVKSLNRNHVTPNIIRFGRDGSGEGIKWYVVGSAGPTGGCDIR